MMQETSVDIPQAEMGPKAAGVPADAEAPMDSVIAGLPQAQPLDEHNRRLIANVHPTDWVNPQPAGRYNMVVIGGDTAGLVTAAGADGPGAA